MNLRKGTAVAGVAAVAIAFGITATSLAGGASVTRPARTTAHTLVDASKKPVTTTYKFKGSYSGTISILWNSNGPSTASIHGKGKGTLFGLTSVSGSGSATASSQSDPINGTGTLKGTGESLTVKFLTGATATAASTTPPTTVTVTGTAKVLKGAGRFKGATGTLKVSGEFSIQGTSGKESDSFSATISGTVKVKKS